MIPSSARLRTDPSSAATTISAVPIPAGGAVSSTSAEPDRATATTEASSRWRATTLRRAESTPTISMLEGQQDRSSATVVRLEPTAIPAT